MEHIFSHFQKNDPVLWGLSRRVHINPPEKSDDFFSDMVENIISQQLSDKAARTIYGRVLDLFPGRKILPQSIISVPDDTLRAAGLSRSKTAFIKDLSGRISSKELILENLAHKKDQEVIDELTKVKGIGIWTAQMFLIFSLGREDVFSFGDLGLQRAIARVYRRKQQLHQRWLEKLTEQWIPYRTYASLLLWKSMDVSDEDLGLI